MWEPISKKITSWSWNTFSLHNFADVFSEFNLKICQCSTQGTMANGAEFRHENVEKTTEISALVYQISIRRHSEKESSSNGVCMITHCVQRKLMRVKLVYLPQTIDLLSHFVGALSISLSTRLKSGPLFTKQMDALLPNFVKSQSSEIRV